MKEKFKIYSFIILLIISVFIVSICLSATGISVFNKMESSKLNVMFYDLGTRFNGDSFIIVYDDIQILIDAGAKPESEEKITTKVDELLVNDPEKTWEYMIFTHPHEDHIANAASVLNMFKYPNLTDGYKLENIIDFGESSSLSDLTSSKKQDLDGLSDEEHDAMNSDDESCYNKYINIRNELANQYGVEYKSSVSLTKSFLLITKFS